MPRLGWLLRCLLPAAVLAVWMHNVVTTDRTPAGDGPHMLAQALHVGAWLTGGEAARAAYEMVRLTAPHPPVGYLPLIFGAMFTRDVRVVIAVSDLFFALLLLDASLRLCRREGWLAGQIAWTMGMATAMTWWSGDFAGFDLAAAATCLQAVSWLHASERLTGRREAIAFAAWLAAAFLTKYSSPLILVAPVGVAGLAMIARGAKLRQWQNLGLALGVFALVAVPYYALNGSAVAAYVQSDLNPQVAPGNFPESSTILERFGGVGQASYFGAIKDQVGWPALVLLLGAAVVGRRWLPLAGVLGGIVTLGAMNSREARYSLPLVFLLTTAGAPLARFGWQHVLGLVALAALTLHGTATTFLACNAECAPAARVFGMDVGAWKTRGAWPEPAESSRPVSEPARAWQVTEVVQAAHDAGAKGLFVVISDRLFCPMAGSYMLAAESLGLDMPIHSVHVLETAGGLKTNTFVGPFGRDVRPDPTVAYVILSDESSDAATWLAQKEGDHVRRFSLPRHATGVLVKWE